uniref:IF rod domain-containing protein n=2 Tax=Leptobrachium leishanense TaxID=445787 RepID=A0A8C5QWP0_9ANUR
MPYRSRTAILSPSGSSHASSSIMSFHDHLEIVHVNTLRIRGLGSWPRNEKRFAGASLSGPSQKEILIDLNDRLASYLKNVLRLEESNGRLEGQIKELLETRRAKFGSDVTPYEKTIAEIKTQINEAKVANSELGLNIENTKLAADDFKAKYEGEQALQWKMIAEIKDLKKELNDLQIQNTYLDTEVQILKQELQSLKDDHDEDIKHLQEKVKHEIHVEVDSSAAITDLSESLTELRNQYQVIADHHKKNAETWFTCKSMEATGQNRIHVESVQSQKIEVFKLRRKLRELESEMKVMLALNSAQENTLHETKSRYCDALQNTQKTICKREEELSKIKAGAEQLSSDSRILGYLKDLLEMEIKTYGILMDDEETRLKDVMADTFYGNPRAANHKQC